MVIKTYIQANTILENSALNFGSNPIMSLFYGHNGYSRIIFKFDLNYIRSFWRDKTFPNLEHLKHRIIMYNAGAIDFRTFTQPCPTLDMKTAERAQSLDIILFKIPQSFDVGNGYDSLVDQAFTFDEHQSCCGSNWFQRKNGKQWGANELGFYSHLDFDYQLPIIHWNAKLKRMRDNDILPSNLTDEQIDTIITTLKLKDGKKIIPYDKVCCGIYDNAFLLQQWVKFLNDEPSLILRTQHFETGSENLDIDITDIINEMIVNEKGISNYGFALAISPELEKIKANPIQTLNFFSNNSSNWFEPHLLSCYQDVIRDDRADFFLDKPNKLYFYSNIGSTPTNLKEMPKCSISGSYENGEEYTLNPIVKQTTKGVYYIDIELNSSDEYTEEREIDANRMFYDTWSNLKTINCENNKTIKIKNKTLEFTTKDSGEYYMIGADSDNIPTPYNISVFGIKYDEKIRRDEGLRKVFVECVIPHTTNQSVIIDDIWYKITADEAGKELDWCDWQPLHRTATSNYFLLDVGSLLPHVYTLHVLTKNKLETRQHTNVVKFEVKSQDKDGHYN